MVINRVLNLYHPNDNNSNTKQCHAPPMSCHCRGRTKTWHSPFAVLYSTTFISDLQRSFKVDTGNTSYCWRSTVIMTLSCIVSEIKRDIGEKSQIFV